MTDVWDLTNKEQGDHVLIALTPDECRQAIAALSAGGKNWAPNDQTRWRVAQEIRRCLRDQKGIGA